MASEIEFPVGIFYRKVGPGAVLAEALFYPEFSRLSPNRAAAGLSVRRNLAGLIPTLPTSEFIRRRRATEARTVPFALVVEPPKVNQAWREPIELTFHAVVWDHPRPIAEPPPPGPRPQPRPGQVVARIVELGIEVIATPADDLIAVLRREALAALRRKNLSTSFQKLAGVQTTLAFEVGWEKLAVKVPSLKDRAVRKDTEGEGKKKSLLQQIATQLGPAAEPAYRMEETVAEIAKALTANPPQSVLLIGPSGVGKTAAVRELARQWANEASRPSLFQTSGARIVAGQSGFGMWEERCQELIKEVVKKRAVLHVGALVELMEVGKSEYNHTGIATFLRPAISRGDFLCVAEATPEQLPLIEKQDPQLLDAFRHITVDEPDFARGKAILAEFAREYPRRLLFVEKETGKSKKKRKRLRRERVREVQREAILLPRLRPLGEAALAAIDRLHRRYATYSAYPGRPLRFLENLLRDTEEFGGVDLAENTGELSPAIHRAPIGEEEVHEAFTRETGLPRAIIDPAVPLDVGEMQRWFAERVVGQAEAVNLVVDLLATVKAGLTRPARPIASLLFIGPTGVGKTEMAKAMAEFLFGSKDRLTRFDMSEFADPVAVRRLVGGAFGSEGLLTAKVREQPFSVLLLDEVEKADASFFDLLLQALGEARLTDAGGRLADFRNTVVILTSNLGAESFRQGLAGFSLTAGAAARDRAGEHFAQAVEQFLRPELFNRLDRVVPFAPLEAGTIRRIADREWHKVLQRDGVRFREVALSTAPNLLDHLAAIGFDPRYGARPLKRAMERELLAPLARQMNRHPGDNPLTVAVGIDGGRPDVAVRPVQGPRGRSNRETTGPMGGLASTVQVLRRWHRLVGTSSIVRELENEVYQLALEEERVYSKQRLGKKLKPADTEVLARLGRLREVTEEVTRQRLAACELEDASLIAFHEGLEPDEALAERLAQAHKEWDRLLLRLYALNAPSSDSITLVLYAEHRGHLAELTLAYAEVARRHGLTVRMMRYDLPDDKVNPNPPPPAIQPPSATNNAHDEPTRETELPPTAWVRERLFKTANQKLLLVRKSLDPRRPEEFASEETIGLALTISGAGTHVRFAGEGGLHDLRTSNNPDASRPEVLVYVESEKVEEYRPPEAALRRGLLRDRSLRREYDVAKGSMRDLALGQGWTSLHGSLDAWLDQALTANMRLRLMRMIVE